MIEIKTHKEDEFHVTVRAPGTTRHTVTLTDRVHAKLAPTASKEDLLRASFEFLLEREPNTAILSRFDLPVISRYFPDYEAEMAERFGAAS